MKLFLIRHAEAIDYETETVKSDDYRFITPKGRKASLTVFKKLKDEFVCLGGVIFSKGYSKNLTTGVGFDKNPLGAKLSINADILIKR